MPSFYLKLTLYLLQKGERDDLHSEFRTFTTFRFWINEVTAGLENIAEEIANATEDQDKEVCFVIGLGGL